MVRELRLLIVIKLLRFTLWVIPDGYYKKELSIFIYSTFDV